MFAWLQGCSKFRTVGSGKLARLRAGDRRGVVGHRVGTASTVSQVVGPNGDEAGRYRPAMAATHTFGVLVAVVGADLLAVAVLCELGRRHRPAR